MFVHSSAEKALWCQQELLNRWALHAAMRRSSKAIHAFSNQGHLLAVPLNVEGLDSCSSRSRFIENAQTLIKPCCSFTLSGLSACVQLLVCCFIEVAFSFLPAKLLRATFPPVVTGTVGKCTSQSGPTVRGASFASTVHAAGKGASSRGIRKQCFNENRKCGHSARSESSAGLESFCLLLAAFGRSWSKHCEARQGASSNISKQT